MNIRNVSATLALLVLGWVYLSAKFMSWLVLGIFPAVLLVGISGYLITSNQPQGRGRNRIVPRQELGRRLRQYWWVYVPAMVLALISTISIKVLHYSGWTMPILHLGGRGTPWLWLWYWLTICWLVAVVLGALVFNPRFANSFATMLGNWIRRGGFWYFWSTDNVPANSLFTLSLILVVSGVLYGPPSAKVDLDQLAYDAQSTVNQLAAKLPQVSASQQDSPTTIAIGAIIGPDAARKLDSIVHQGANKVSSGSVDLIKEPQPRYVRGWVPLTLALFFLLPGLFGMAFSRRDEAATFFEGIVGRMKRAKDKGVEVAAGALADNATPTSAAETAVGGDTKFSKLLASDLLSDIVVTFATYMSRSLRRA